jgi:hypothetical protein
MVMEVVVMEVVVVIPGVLVVYLQEGLQALRGLVLV